MVRQELDSSRIHGSRDVRPLAARESFRIELSYSEGSCPSPEPRWCIGCRGSLRRAVQRGVDHAASSLGSIINEEFGRLGLGKIITVAPQNVERKKLNPDGQRYGQGRGGRNAKVDVCSKAVLAMGLGTETVPIPENLVSRMAVMAIAEADILVGPEPVA